MNGCLAPRMVREREDLARFMEGALSEKDVVGIGGIIAILDEHRPSLVRDAKGPDLRRLISFTMRDIGWEPNTRGHAGRASSWKRP
jgi:hypothetical protein